MSRSVLTVASPIQPSMHDRHLAPFCNFWVLLTDHAQKAYFVSRAVNKAPIFKIFFTILTDFGRSDACEESKIQPTPTSFFSREICGCLLIRKWFLWHGAAFDAINPRDKRKTSGIMTKLVVSKTAPLASKSVFK